MEGDGKPAWVWGGAAPMAPSQRRIEPWGWVCASAVGGAAAATAALLLGWRPLPWLPLPPGALGMHASHWAAIAVHALAPHLFEGKAASYASFWASLPPAEQAGAVVRLALAAVAAAVPAFLLAKPMLLPRDELIELRGAKRFEGPQATKALKAAVAAGVARRPGPAIAPGVAYPRELYARHLLIVGGVGSGKSTCLRPLVDQIARSGEQVLLFDAKSEFTSAYPGMALIAPWDARSLAWDIGRDMRSVLDMERFAAAVIKESSDPMWSSAARLLLVGVMKSLRGERGSDWGWSDLRDRLVLGQPALLAIMQAWHPIAVRLVAKTTATSAGILTNLMSFCSAIFHLADAWGGHAPERRFSVVEWTLGGSKVRQVILQGHGGYPTLAKACAEGVLGAFASLVASVEMPDDAGRKLWFVADEFAQLGAVPVMELFSLGRSRGLACVAAMQDFAQLEQIYGAPQAKALISMCGTVIVGQTAPGDTAKALCESFGVREVERRNVSTQGSERGQSASVSFAREQVPLYLPSELSTRLGLLPDGSGSRLILFTGGVAYELVWPLFDIPTKRAAHVGAPWLRGLNSPVAFGHGLGGVENEALAAGSPLPTTQLSDPFGAEPASTDPSLDDELALPFDDASTADALDDSVDRLALPRV